MKQIIYSLSLLLLLLGCSKSDEINYAELSVGFVKNKIDVGENSGVLEIPVILSGCKNDVSLSVMVQVSSTDQSAVAGTDYELLDKQLIFNTSGTSMIRVRIIDNDKVTDGVKDFSINLKVETAGVHTSVSSAQVYIVNDDAKPFVLAGHYTLTAQGVKDGLNYTSEAGGVEIVEDEATPGTYYMRNMVLVNGTNVLPLTKADELYFRKDDKGELWMPVMLNIGDYGHGDGITIGLTTDGFTTDAPIKIVISGNRLAFVDHYFAGVYLDVQGNPKLYYAFKNMLLEKKIDK